MVKSTERKATLRARTCCLSLVLYLVSQFLAFLSGSGNPSPKLVVDLPMRFLHDLPPEPADRKFIGITRRSFATLSKRRDFPVPDD
jgi:hypothetical protein